MINGWLGIGERQSFGSLLARHRGVGPGFDLLRIGLALYIFYGHALWIAGGATSVAGVAAISPDGHSGFSGWTRPFHVAAVPLFFALSGFLVIGSAFRLRATSTFLAFRFLRIFPALVVETTLCAVLLGAALTTLPLADYYGQPTFWRYLGNMAGWISFDLPGVFQSNPVHGVVNANLWTLPSEFDCYLITALLMMSGIIYNRALFTCVYAITGTLLLAASLLTGFAVTDGIIAPVGITFYFFTGVLVYHWRDAVPAHWAIFLGCATVSYALLMAPWTVFIAPLPLTYCMAFFGMVSVPKLPLIGRGDYSYGIYLYGFPICQALVAAFPLVFIGHRLLLLSVGFVATCAFAAFSWHAIEIHALKIKRYLPARVFPKRAPLGRPQSSREDSVVPSDPLHTRISAAIR